MKVFASFFIIFFLFAFQLHELSHTDLVDHDSHTCSACVVKSVTSMADAPAIDFEFDAPLFVFQSEFVQEYICDKDQDISSHLWARGPPLNV